MTRRPPPRPASHHRRHAVQLVVAGALAVALVALPGRADAAGVTTHAWMGLAAVDRIADPDLRALLETHRDQVEGGAQFPDGGYFNNTIGGVPGGDYGEEAHWQRFFDARADQIRSQPGCGDLRAADGPCAGQVAHLMGMAAHGMGDQVWDWLFEPQAADRGERYVPAGLEAVFNDGGIESQMDVVAIGDHGRPTSPDTPPIPAVDQLAASFALAGRPDITPSGLQSGKNGLAIIRAGEAALAPQHLDAIKAAMPWTSANMVTAPGGVDFASVAVAALWETIWGRLLGTQPATRVSITAPTDGQRDVPTTGWERTFLPGSSPSRGGASNRITAVLSYALPYVPSASDTTTQVPVQLPAGAMTLTDQSTGAPVPIMAGYPKAVPYGPDAGEHMIDIQPAADLTTCTTYRVDVTDRLIDAEGVPVTPMRWTFTTDGCPDPPPASSSTTTSTVAPSSLVPASSTTRPSGGGAVPALPVAAVAVAANPRFTG